MTTNLKKIELVLERPGDGSDLNGAWGTALARVVEAHPALAVLLDFESPDPRLMAAEVGVTYPLDSEEWEDLQEIDFGPAEWFEPSAGLAAVHRALGAVRTDPGSVAAAIYDPTLRVEDIMLDLEAMERVLRLAQQHETRFHLALHT